MIAVDHSGRQTILLPVDPQEGNHEWYSLLGFLMHRGYAMRAPCLALCERKEGQGTIVLLAGKADRRLERAGEILKTFGPSWRTAIVGREVAYQHEAYRLMLGGRGRAVPGDPHHFVAAILEGRSGAEVPELWDPADYRCSYLDAPWIGNTAYLRFGNGCQRSCGYCPYGYHFQRIYGSDRVRVRPAAALEREIDQWVSAGKRDFRLVADQVLICPEEHNDSLEEVCKMIASRANGNRVFFTTTPSDVVRNRRLLARCQRQVSLRIMLCFDLMVDPMLARFDLPSREGEIAEAVNVLSSLRIEILPHFIFLHPFMNSASVLRVIDLIERIVPKVHALKDPSAVAFIRSLFCSALRQDEVTPPDPQLRLDLEHSVPEAGALGLAAVMIRLFHSEALYSRFVQAIQKHADWPKRLAAACRDLVVRGEDGSLLEEQAVAFYANHMFALIEGEGGKPPEIGRP